MTIKDQIWLLAHSKNPEDRREWAVLYWKAQGLTHRQVAEKLAHGKDWVQRYMTSAYKRFGSPEDLDRDEKWQWLVENVFPALKEFIEGNPDTLKELPPLEPEVVVGEPVDDEPKETKTFPGPKTPTRPPMSQNLIGCLVTIGILVIIIGGALLFGNRNTPSPTSPVVIASPIPQVLATPVPALPQIIATNASLAATDTSVPQAKDFYNQGEWAPLRDSVYVRITPDFETASSGTCAPSNPGFAVTLEIHNTGGQFLIRFDPSAFEAQDDLGNQYTLEGAGINVCNAVGPQAYPATSYEYLRLKFSGQVPLNTQYLIITADSLSGVKVVFHKQY